MPADGALDPDEEWYFDLARGVAVPASQRGQADHMLGPYATRGEAENWKARSEARNDAWEQADDDWEHAGDQHDDRGSGDA